MIEYKKFTKWHGNNSKQFLNTSNHGKSRLITRFCFLKVKMNCDDSVQPLYIPIGQPCLQANSRHPSKRRRHGTERECDVTSELVEGDWEQGFTLGKVFFASSLFELASLVWLREVEPFMYRIFNNYSLSPSGLWVNSASWDIDSEAMRARGIIFLVKSN